MFHTQEMIASVSVSRQCNVKMNRKKPTAGRAGERDSGIERDKKKKEKKQLKIDTDEELRL